MKIRKILLAALSILPISSVAFAATNAMAKIQAEESVDSSQLSTLFDQNFFSDEFYEAAKNAEIYNGEDLANPENKEKTTNLRKLGIKEVVEARFASGPRSDV